MPITATIESATTELESTYAKAEAHFGRVPNFIKALGTNPAFCKSLTDFLVQAMGEGRISWALKELTILKTLRATGAYYGYGAHEKMALELGNSADKIGDLNNSLWKISPHFDNAERAVLALVEQTAVDANDVGDDIWGPLHEHYDSGQLLEIASIINTFINIGRMGDALGVSDPILFAQPVG
mgnify:CR=1 FL=1